MNSGRMVITPAISIILHGFKKFLSFSKNFKTKIIEDREIWQNTRHDETKKSIHVGKSEIKSRHYWLYIIFIDIQSDTKIANKEEKGKKKRKKIPLKKITKEGIKKESIVAFQTYTVTLTLIYKFYICLISGASRFYLLFCFWDWSVPVV